MNVQTSAVRSKNFTDAEVNLLAQLVNKQKKVLECKETGLVTNKQKSGAWEELSKHFNATSASGIPRTSKVLKDKWTNLKKNAVRNCAADKKHLKGTGGGPPKPPKETVVDSIVNDILGDRRTGLPSECDSDVIPTEILQTEMLDESVSADDQRPDIQNSIIRPTASVSWIQEIEEEEQVAIDDIQHVNENTVLILDSSSTSLTGGIDPALDWSDYTPVKLKQPISSQLTSEVKGKKKGKVTGALTNEKWCKVADKKNQLYDLKIEHLKSENDRKKELHEINKKCIEEQHKLRLKLMQEEHDFKLKLMQEEHKKPM